MADDISVLAAEAIEFEDAMGIEKAHFVGISMGGMVGQQVGIDYPDRVNKLVLGCTWPGGPWMVRPVPELYQYLTVPGKGRLEDLKTVDPLALVISQMFIDEDPEGAEAIREMVEATREDNDNEAFYGQQTAIRKFNVYDLLPNIKAEALVISPKYDILLPPANGCLIATQIPNSHFLFLENSSHPMIEDGEQFAQAIADFLRD